MIETQEILAHLEANSSRPDQEHPETAKAKSRTRKKKPAADSPPKRGTKPAGMDKDDDLPEAEEPQLSLFS